jgi:hypothetical protein
MAMLSVMSRGEHRHWSWRIALGGYVERIDPGDAAGLYSGGDTGEATAIELELLLVLRG